jgi:RHS repeat-associated protein
MVALAENKILKGGGGGPTGDTTILNADFSTPPSGTQPLVNNPYQGMTLDSVTGLYYERNRNYSPSLGTWISQDPLQYVNGANTYQFVGSGPVGNVDATGAQVYIGPGSGYPQDWNMPTPAQQEASYIREMLSQASAWISQGDPYAGMMMGAYALQIFPSGNAVGYFEGIYHEILKSKGYQRAAQAYFQKKAEEYGKPGTYKLGELNPLSKNALMANFTPNYALLALNLLRGTHVPDLGVALGNAHFGYKTAVLKITGCPGHLRWSVSATLWEGNNYHFVNYWKYRLDPVYNAGVELNLHSGFKPFYQQSIWQESFHGRLPAQPSFDGEFSGNMLTIPT